MELKPLMTTCAVALIAAVALMATGIAVPTWMDSGSSSSALSKAIGYTSIGLFQVCLTVSKSLTCGNLNNSIINDPKTQPTVIAEATTILADVLIAIAACLCLIYVCWPKVAGASRGLLLAILFLEFIGVGSGAAGAGVYYYFYLGTYNLSSLGFGLSYAGYIFFAGVGLALMGLLMTLIELCNFSQNNKPPPPPPPRPQRQDSDENEVPVYVYQPNQPPKQKQRRGQVKPAGPPGPLSNENTPPHERLAAWPNQVATYYRQYYESYYQNLYNQRQPPVPTLQQL